MEARAPPRERDGRVMSAPGFDLFELVFTVRDPDPQEEAAARARIVEDARAFGLSDVEVTAAGEVVVVADAVAARAFVLHVAGGATACPIRRTYQKCN